MKNANDCSCCRKNYPEGQTSEIFAGGGECRSRRNLLRLKDGCPFFEPLKWQTVAQMSFYELRRELADSRRILLHDRILGAPIVEFCGKSDRESLEMAAEHFSRTEAYLHECLRILSEFQKSNKSRLPVFVGGMNFDTSDKYDGTSAFSRHFRLLMKHNDRPIQINFQVPMMIGRKSSAMVSMRILHEGEGIRMMVKCPEIDRFVRLDEIVMSRHIGNDFISYIIDEFRNHLAIARFFFEALKSEAGKK